MPGGASGTQATVNPFRPASGYFASGYFDSATGLTKFGERYYDSSLGRWTQRDPIAGSIGDPANLDRYVYAGDSPVNVADVSGRLSVTGNSICLSNAEVGLLVIAASAGVPGLVLALDAIAAAGGPVGEVVATALEFAGAPSLVAILGLVAAAGSSGQGLSLTLRVVGFVPLITPDFC